MKQMFFILAAMFVTVFAVQVVIPYQEEEVLAEVPEEAILDIQEDFPQFTQEEAIQYYLDNKNEIDCYYASNGRSPR